MALRSQSKTPSPSNNSLKRISKGTIAYIAGHKALKEPGIDVKTLINENMNLKKENETSL